jgi:hypothetical protein
MEGNAHFHFGVTRRRCTPNLQLTDVTCTYTPPPHSVYSRLLPHLPTPHPTHTYVQHADSGAVLAPLSGPGFLITDWLPQNDVLAHPNCTLFVSHGGFNGVTEAAYHGVPTVVIPSLGDQVGCSRMCSYGWEQ